MNGSTKCDKHTVKAKSGWVDYNKGKTASQNGYGAAWRKLRDAVLIRDRHLCLVCYRLGIFTPAKQVDHIINKDSGGTNDLSNLQSICVKCHKRKTNEEAIRSREKAK